MSHLKGDCTCCLCLSFCEVVQELGLQFFCGESQRRKKKAQALARKGWIAEGRGFHLEG